MACMSLFMAGVFKKKEAIPIYLDEDGKDNIMPYYDEGAGEDDFQNFDLEQLLKHAGGAGFSGFSADGFCSATITQGGASGAGCDLEMEPLITSQQVCEVENITTSNAFESSQQTTNCTSNQQTTSSNVCESNQQTTSSNVCSSNQQTTSSNVCESTQQSSSIQQTSTTIQNSSSTQQQTTLTGCSSIQESLEVLRFIETRLAYADSEDAAYPRDTLLHYGYEGEGSDVDDLSEIEESDGEDEDDEDDFTFMLDWGPKFEKLNAILNPVESESEDDV
jgi:hypothetical protein